MVMFAPLGQLTQTLLHSRLGRLQVQVRLPGVFMQVPAPQPPLLVLHSLMSMQAVPLLLYPVAQDTTVQAPDVHAPVPLAMVQFAQPAPHWVRLSGTH